MCQSGTGEERKNIHFHNDTRSKLSPCCDNINLFLHCDMAFVNGFSLLAWHHCGRRQHENTKALFMSGERERERERERGIERDFRNIITFKRNIGKHKIESYNWIDMIGFCESNNIFRFRIEWTINWFFELVKTLIKGVTGVKMV